MSSTEVKAGTSVTVTSVPNDGYMVKDILINGVSVGSNAEVYTVKSVSENMKIQVIFGEKTDLPFIDVEKTVDSMIMLNMFMSINLWSV